MITRRNIMFPTRLALSSITVALLASLLSAGTPAPDHARQWLRESAEALGGEATLRAIKATEISGVSMWQQREQSERPEGPWVETFNDFTDVRNFAADAIRRTTRVRGYSAADWVNTRDWEPATTTLIVGGVSLRRGDDGFAPTGTPWDIGAIPLELGPEKVIVTALDAADVHADNDVPFHGYPHHAVSFTDRGARVRLLLNPPGMTPAAVEITRARPYDVFWTSWGDVITRLTFGVWLLEPEGIRFPRLWEYSTGGQVDGTVNLTRVRLSPPITDSEFSIPDDVRTKYVVNRRRVADLPLGSQRRPIVELAPGIVKVPANFDVAEVKQDDGIVVLEGPLTSSYSEKVLDDVRARFAAGVKAVVTTSDSWPHIGGMREYVARGVPIYALDLNAPILNRLFAAPYLSFPDALAKAPRSANLQLVRAKTMLGGGANRIELCPLRTVSGERQMLVYFPEHRLLYTSDLFTILPNGQVFLPQQVSEAVGAVAREHLAVDRAFGMHYDVLPWSRVVDSARPPKYD